MGRAVAASRGQSGKGYTAGLWAARQSGEQVICHSVCWCVSQHGGSLFRMKQALMICALLGKVVLGLYPCPRKPF